MPESGAISILCVDDEELFLDAYSQLLRNMGFSVTSVTDVAEALRLLETEYFDVISADYAMPEMDGIAFLREIRSRGIQSLFVIVTAKRLAHISIDAINAGADYYIQKGTEMTPMIRKLADFIKKSVPEKNAGKEIEEWEKFYQSVVEHQGDIILRLEPSGTIRFANEAGVRFFNTPYNDLLDTNFFEKVPEDDRRVVMEHLETLSETTPDALFEHRVAAGSKPVMLQLSYRAFFGQDGSLIQYQVSGREIARIVRVGTQKTVAAPAPAQPAPPSSPPVPAPAPVQPAATATSAPPQPPAPPVIPGEPAGPENAEAPDWSGLIDTLQNIDTPVFAVNRRGVVVAWNNAMEQLTGVSADGMTGKGAREYAVPFYGKPTAMLIDQIIAPPGTVPAGLSTAIRKVGDTFIGDMEHVTIKGKPMLLWAKGSPVYDARGVLIAAIQSVTVGEPQPGKDAEEYIGGVSSITLKLSGEGMGGAIAGAIGSSTGGFGVYATNRRLFVIRNPELNPEAGKGGVQFSTFMMDELFGTTVDTRPKSVADLERLQVFEAPKEKIERLELKKPVLLSGHLTIVKNDKNVFRVYIDHKKAYSHIEKLMTAFSPDNLKIE